MTKIKPRWEWRSFGSQFGTAEAQLAKLTPSGSQESDELYLLSGASDNVKVRDGLMDIKALKAVNANGFEQWAPVMKAGFPLSAADVVKVLESLHVPVPSISRASFTLDQFLKQFAAPTSAIRIVKVHKRRTRYTIEGCSAELTELVADGNPTRTLAVESENAAAVNRVVRKLGLGSYINTGYQHALTALLDALPERYAVIDAGTNSIKFNISERGRNGQWHTVVDRAEITRLGEGLAQQGVISDAAVRRTVVAIASMVDEAKRHGARAIAAVGTAGLRAASNCKQVVAILQRRTGVQIEVISGEEEGRLAYLAATSALALRTGSLVVFDTGGGSSQFTFGHDTSVDERFSVEVGAVRYTERYQLDGAVSPEVLREAMAAIAVDLSRINARPVPDALVAMGGAVTNITAVKHQLAHYDPAVVQGAVIDRAEIDRQIELYRSRDAVARRAIIGLQPQRAGVILAGACIIRTVMEKLGKESVTVSDRGLRHGVLAEYFEAVATGLTPSDEPRPGVLRSPKTINGESNIMRTNVSTQEAAIVSATKTTAPRKRAISKKVTKAAAKVMAKAPARVAAKPSAVRKHAKLGKHRTPAAEPALAKEQVLKVLELSKGSNSIELKLSVPVAEHRATIKSLRLDPVEAQPRQVYFFDTPNLDLSKAGVVVRARRIQGGRADTVVKLRPVDPANIDQDLRRSGSFKIEVDVMPGGFVCSASLKGVCTGKEVLNTTTGDMPISSLFSREQRAFYDEHAPAGITMDSLAVLGPTFLLKAKHQPKEFDRPVTVEMWLYPDGSRVLEISTKCLPQEGFQVAGEFKVYIASCGIALSAAQAPKTKTALEFFSKELKQSVKKTRKK